MGPQNIHPHPPPLENAFWPEMGGGGGEAYIISLWIVSSDIVGAECNIYGEEENAPKSEPSKKYLDLSSAISLEKFQGATSVDRPSKQKIGVKQKKMGSRK